MKKFKNATMNDVFAGIIVAFISIPISMGYAQVAGLPMVYGLYGSLVPILVFSLFTTSHDFVFGVDAAPAALTGSALATLGIFAGTKEAMQVVAVFALMVALWLKHLKTPLVIQTLCILTVVGIIRCTDTSHRIKSVNCAVSLNLKDMTRQVKLIWNSNKRGESPSFLLSYKF